MKVSESSRYVSQSIVITILLIVMSISVMALMFMATGALN